MTNCRVHNRQVLPLNLVKLALDPQRNVLNLHHNLFSWLDCVLGSLSLVTLCHPNQLNLEKFDLFLRVLLLFLDNPLDLVHLGAFEDGLGVGEDAAVNGVDVLLQQLKQGQLGISSK